MSITFSPPHANSCSITLASLLPVPTEEDVVQDEEPHQIPCTRRGQVPVGGPVHRCGEYNAERPVDERPTTLLDNYLP